MLHVGGIALHSCTDVVRIRMLNHHQQLQTHCQCTIYNILNRNIEMQAADIVYIICLGVSVPLLDFNSWTVNCGQICVKVAADVEL